MKQKKDRRAAANIQNMGQLNDLISSSHSIDKKEEIASNDIKQEEPIDKNKTINSIEEEKKDNKIVNSIEKKSIFAAQKKKVSINSLDWVLTHRVEDKKSMFAKNALVVSKKHHQQLSKLKSISPDKSMPVIDILYNIIEIGMTAYKEDIIAKLTEEENVF